MQYVTTKEQSERLRLLLKPDTCDFFYPVTEDGISLPPRLRTIAWTDLENHGNIPCWSAGKLMEAFPVLEIRGMEYRFNIRHSSDSWVVSYKDIHNTETLWWHKHEYLVECLVSAIERLVKEQRLTINMLNRAFSL